MFNLHVARQQAISFDRTNIPVRKCRIERKPERASKTQKEKKKNKTIDIADKNQVRLQLTRHSCVRVHNILEIYLLL